MFSFGTGPATAESVADSHMIELYSYYIYVINVYIIIDYIIIRYIHYYIIRYTGLGYGE